MSTSVCQYLMYAVKLEKEKFEEDNFSDKYDGYMDTSSYAKEVKHLNGIFCLFDGMNGDYAFVGKVLAKSREDYNDGYSNYLGYDNGLIIPELSEDEKDLVVETVNKDFELKYDKKDFKHYIITHFS